MKQLSRLVAVFVIAATGLVVLPAPAGAKMLPYELAVLGGKHRVGRPVLVRLIPDRQNVLPPKVAFEVRWAKVRPSLDVASSADRPGHGVLMRQIAPSEYRGTVKPKSPGQYVVYGRMSRPELVSAGYPAPIVIRVKR